MWSHRHLFLVKCSFSGDFMVHIKGKNKRHDVSFKRRNTAAPLYALGRDYLVIDRLLPEPCTASLLHSPNINAVTLQNVADTNDNTGNHRNAGKLNIKLLCFYHVFMKFRGKNVPGSAVHPQSVETTCRIKRSSIKGTLPCDSWWDWVSPIACDCCDTQSSGQMSDFHSACEGKWVWTVHAYESASVSFAVYEAQPVCWKELHEYKFDFILQAASGPKTAATHYFSPWLKVHQDYRHICVVEQLISLLHLVWFPLNKRLKPNLVLHQVCIHVLFCLFRGEPVCSRCFEL